jgi:hypothetical protein
MHRLFTVLLAAAAVLAIQPNTAGAQSAAYFAQLERNRIACANAGKEWDGRRCHGRGFFKGASAQCKRWQAACNAGYNRACGNYEANCQVN